MRPIQWFPVPDFSLPGPIEVTYDPGELRSAPRNPSSLVDDSPGVVLRAQPPAEST